MSQKCTIVLLSALLILGLATVAAADEPIRIFNLSHEDPDDQEQEAEDEFEEVFIPGIKAGEIHCSVSMGQLNLATTLLQHDQIIYKYTDKDTYWGDMELTGQSAFNPIARVSYNLSKWMTVEGAFSISVTEYSMSIANTHSRANGDSLAPIVNDPELGEYDLESRSLLTMGAAANAMIYPLNINGDGVGRWHPYITAGIGYTHVTLNSNYIGEASKSLALSGGIGMRVIADDLISLRFDIAFNHIPLDFKPAQYFRELDEGMRLVPVAEFTTEGPIGAEAIHENVLTEFENETLNAISYGIGFVATF